MEIIYTWHAKMRMAERGITKDDVEEVIKGEHRTKRLLDEPDKYALTQKRFNRIYEVICYVKGNTYIIKTVYF